MTALVVVALTVDGPVKGGPFEVVPWVAPAAVGIVLIERWRHHLVRDVTACRTHYEDDERAHAGS